MLGQASAIRRTSAALIGGPPASGKSCRTQGLPQQPGHVAAIAEDRLVALERPRRGDHHPGGARVHDRAVSSARLAYPGLETPTTTGHAGPTREPAA